MVITMVFSSPEFIIGFLVITLALYFAAPRRLKNLVLFLVSLFFYAWGGQQFIVVMLISITSAYIFGFFIEKYRETNIKRAKIFLAVSLLINLAFLLFFKYANFFIENISLIPFLNGLKPIKGLVLPVGISFYTFQIMSYSIDCYRGETKAQRNFIAFGAYVVLFPQLIAGPIVRYRDIDDMLTERRETVDKFASGAVRFCAGLAKKIILADSAAAIIELVKNAHTYGGTTVLGSWLIVVAYTFQIYFDFSAYSDMAIGLGRMFGFEFLENFNYPYMARSITDFWRRWHMSLSTWFKEYVYIPLGGNRKGILKQYRNIAIVWFLTGFWHGAAWNFILWGMYFGIILMLEKTFLLRALDRAPKLVGHIYALILIIFGWLLFMSGSLSEMAGTAKAMFGFGSVLTNPVINDILKRSVPLLAVFTVGSTPYVKKAFDKLTSRGALVYARPVAACAALVLSISYMVDSAFSPFLYYIF